VSKIVKARKAVIRAKLVYGLQALGRASSEVEKEK
jgi:hypothetical protein